jgi:hypothetical protein
LWLAIMQRAPSNPCGFAPFLRVTLATVVAVFASTTLVACERDSTDKDKDTATTTPAAGERFDEKRSDQPTTAQGTQPGAAQPGTGQPGQQGTGQQGTDQPGMGQPGMGQPGTAEGTMGAQDMMAQQNQACPMVVEDAVVDVEDTKDGVALVFTSVTVGNVEDLRNRVQEMGRMYEKHAGSPDSSMMWQSTGHRRADQDQTGTAPTGLMPAVKTKIENTDTGARLEFTATEQAQLDPLREHVRYHERRIEAGDCWIEQRPGHRPGEAAPGDGSGTRPKTAP